MPSEAQGRTASVDRGLRDLIAGAAVEERAELLDGWLAGLLPPGGGVALVAVGGLGRRELPPYPDVDLLLLHDGWPGIGTVADQVWYPIWEQKLPLDHAVRTVEEALAVADQDVKAALGLLDARHLAGDPALTARLRGVAVGSWQSRAAHRLAALREVTEARWRDRGELAFLLEGDLKEARGGLRDATTLRGIGYAQIADTPRPAARAAAARLRETREALHHAAGRRCDRLLAELREPVAALLGVPDREALLRRVSEDARTLAYAADDAWRAVDRWRSRSGKPGPRRPLADGVIESGGEVRLARALRPDPVLPLRVAAAAATHRLPIAVSTLDWLAAHCPPLPEPWPATARQTFLTLLGAGPALVDVWEACDRAGLVTRWLPEWGRVRFAPQYDPVHRHTVDRHLIETAATAARYAHEVARPDLLVLGALVHDLGKGLGAAGDHCVAGVAPAHLVCARIGLSAADTGVIVDLVRHHLLLADVATRRDLADPATLPPVAEAVGTVDQLDLLYALTLSDAAATGPGAWSDWKGKLVAELVGRVAGYLGSGPVPAPGLPDPARFAGGPLPVVTWRGGLVSVLAPDRPGLLAAVAGCLARHRLDVLGATVAVSESSEAAEGRALVECEVRPRYGDPPAADLLLDALRRAVLSGPEPPRPVEVSGDVRLRWCQDATDATILEVRAPDAPGLLHRITTALTRAGADVRTARVATYGAAAVDAFYLVGDFSRAVVEAEVRAGCSGPGGDLR
ncbi:[protein-PII] uridylyltransferase [Longispora sp. K20-0274]|uniref:[protein-PII] uridylyltransferase n=1 Tax=Longispora sp. K20-0274 TaxID=3088255 RepID=UPI00399B0F59